MRVEGHVSRKAIRYWLENYQALAAHDVGIDDMPRNSGAPAYDGVSSRQLNKVMLDDALKKLPPRIAACAAVRWIKCWDVPQALKALKVSKDVYYARCDQAVDLLYRQLNGTMLNYLDLVEELRKGLAFPSKTKKAH